MAYFWDSKMVLSYSLLMRYETRVARFACQPIISLVCMRRARTRVETSRRGNIDAAVVRTFARE